MNRLANVCGHVVSFLCLILAGCGSGGGDASGGHGGGGMGGRGGTGGDPVALEVLSTVPADRDSDVDPDVVLSATFDQPIEAASLSASSFSVSQVGGDAVGGGVTLHDGQTAIYELDTPLALLTEYTATVSTDVRAVSGDMLVDDVTWGFATRDGVWSSPEQIETDDGGSATRPIVAMSANGEALVAWIEITDLFSHAWANHYSPELGWDEAGRIEAFDDSSAQEIDLAIDSMGRGIAVWTEVKGGGSDILATRYADGVWEDPRAIRLDTPQQVGAPKIAMSPSGEAVAVWIQGESGLGNNVRANRYTPGVGWADDAAIHQISGMQTTFDPDVAIASNGDAIAVWSQAVPGSVASVYANRYSPMTGWGQSQLISGGQSAVDSRNAKVAVNSNGNAVVVWVAEPSSAPPNVWASQFVVGTGWTAPSPVAEDALDSVQAPHVSMDGAGNAFAVWFQRKVQTRSIVVRRFDPSSGWGATETLFSLDQSMRGFLNDPNIAADEKGNAIAVWTKNDEPQAQAFASRYVLGIGWSEPQTLAEISTGTSRDPTVGIDSLGRGLTARNQFDGTRFNIWANHFE